MDKYCVHGNQKGHTKETCFYLHGIPNCYKEMKEKRNNFVAAVAPVDKKLIVQAHN